MAKNISLNSSPFRIAGCLLVLLMLQNVHAKPFIFFKSVPPSVTVTKSVSSASYTPSSQSVSQFSYADINAQKINILTQKIRLLTSILQGCTTGSGGVSTSAGGVGYGFGFNKLCAKTGWSPAASTTTTSKPATTSEVDFVYSPAGSDKLSETISSSVTSTTTARTTSKATTTTEADIDIEVTNRPQKPATTTSSGSGYEYTTTASSGSGYKYTTTAPSGSGYEYTTTAPNGSGYKYTTTAPSGSGYEYTTTTSRPTTVGYNYQGPSNAAEIIATNEVSSALENNNKYLPPSP